MNGWPIFVILMSIAIILVGIGLKWRIPYPITLVLGGAALGFIPGLKEIHFNPNLILIIVLPPILFYAAYSISNKEFLKNIYDILWLALGLVLATTFIVALIFKGLFPEYPWALAFAFGAIISPPDAVAATAILKRFSINSRLLTILEGESLINDATGLVLYKLAVIALLAGSFSVTEASFEFVQMAIGGIAIGILSGYFLNLFSSKFFSPILAVVFSFAIPYIAYSAADFFEVSGVLAVVINGLIGSRLLITHFMSLTRIIAWVTWDVFIIMLNCFIFILIGLQLQGIVERLTFSKAFLYSFYAFLITAAMMLIRFIWVYARNRAICMSRNIVSQFCQTNFGDAAIISWCGMRGIVSLAAALALPFYLPDGADLPGRDVVIFLTFLIIVYTMLIAGLSLPLLLKSLHVEETEEIKDATIPRKKLIRTAQSEIENLRQSKLIEEEDYLFLLSYFKLRHQMLEISSRQDKLKHPVESARLKIISRKRKHLIEMWEKNEINDELFNLLEGEIDLEESSIARAIL